jgi:hypothetical protein
VHGLTVTPEVNPALPDLFPPLINGLEFGKRLNLEFTDDLDPVTATNPANYVIKEPIGTVLTVLGAELKGSRNVLLSTGPQKPLLYKLIVSSVKDESGNAMGADTLSFKGVGPAAIEPTPYRPINLGADNTPDGVKIQLETAVEAGGPVSLSIFDVSGRVIRTISWDGSGRTWSLVWTGEADNGHHAPEGVYFIRAVSRFGSATTRCVLTR